MLIDSISLSGVVKCKTRHGLEDNDTVLFSEVLGLNGINGQTSKVKVIDAQSIQLDKDISKLTPYENEGLLITVKTPISMSYEPYDHPGHQLNPPLDPSLQFFDMDKPHINETTHVCFKTLDRYRAECKALPRPWDPEDIKGFVALAEADLKAVPEDRREPLEKQLALFAGMAGLQLAAVAAFMGGMVAQECLKAVTNKFVPVHQYFYQSFNELAGPVASVEEACKERAGCGGWLASLLGREAAKAVGESKLFVVGAGAIGCELLKNMAMAGVGRAGEIVVTDPDHIENSNLNRQFLFREAHIRKPKSATAAAAIAQMAPWTKGHILAYTERVDANSEHTFSNEFLKSRTAVANALDNVAARKYVDSRCVRNRVALLDSGTLGPKGHVQVVLPFRTESYGEQADPEEENEIPYCTLKMFPEDIVHCVEWARDKFSKAFTSRAVALSNLHHQPGTPVEPAQVASLVKLVETRPLSFEDCLQAALRKFYKYFRNDPLQLLHTYPPDLKLKSGDHFWKLPKRRPVPIPRFDCGDRMHVEYLVAAAVLRAKVHCLDYPKDWRDPEIQGRLCKAFAGHTVPDFVPSENKREKILSEEAGGKEEQKGKKGDEPEKGKLESLLKSAPQVKPQHFEKDDDSNGHIDWIYAMSNLRGRVYSMQGLDKLQVKLKAGRIMPALATTTSVVAAYQTLQLVMVIRQQVDQPKQLQCRSIFVNLAVPLAQVAEPGPPLGKAAGPHRITVWDTWQVTVPPAASLKQLFAAVFVKY